MGIQERKEKERLIRKNDIIDAAERVFFQKSFQQSTMDEIAKESEFTKRTIYSYFQSKEQLYCEIMLRAFKILNDMILKALENNRISTGIDRMKILKEIFVEFNKQYPDYFKAIADYENQETDFNSQDEVIIECYKEGERSFVYLKEALKQGIDEGDIVEDLNIDYTATVLWASIMGVCNIIAKKENYLKYYCNCNSSQLIDEAFRFIMRSIIKNKGE